MSYRDGFDSLGNPLPTRKADWQQKLIQRGAWFTAAVCCGMLIWLR
jgi:hypothetical protein